MRSCKGILKEKITDFYDVFSFYTRLIFLKIFYEKFTENLLIFTDLLYFLDFYDASMVLMHQCIYNLLR